MKKILKAVLGQNLINKIRGVRSLPNKVVIPVDDPIEIKMRHKFYSLFVQKGDLVFDVGANVGNRISPMLAIGANVIAVEPQQDCINILKRKFGSSIKIVPLGLGEKEGEMELFISNASTISSFSKDWIEAVRTERFKEYNWNKSVKIRMTTLDLLIKKYGVPKFIKIDVEGFEQEVLKGLHQLIPFISFEYTTPEQTVKANACVEYLYGLNENVQFNYSVGESMNLELNQWLEKDEMIEIIHSTAFIATGFGDIYVKN